MTLVKCRLVSLVQNWYISLLLQCNLLEQDRNTGKITGKVVFGLLPKSWNAGYAF